MQKPKGNRREEKKEKRMNLGRLNMSEVWASK